MVTTVADPLQRRCGLGTPPFAAIATRAGEVTDETTRLSKASHSTAKSLAALAGLASLGESRSVAATTSDDMLRACARASVGAGDSSMGKGVHRGRAWGSVRLMERLAPNVMMCGCEYLQQRSQRWES